MLLVGVLAAPFLIGCPPGMCLLKTCTVVNGREDCSCPWSTCGDGAKFDTNTNACVCKPGLFTVEGQCLDQTQANAFCGKGREWGAQGCAAKKCGTGQQIDEGTGECKDVAAVASSLGVSLKKGETIGCPAGQKLTTEGGNAACVPIEQTCAPDEAYDGSQCVKARSCPTGAVFDADSKQCIAFGKSESDSFTVDTTSWSIANYGKNGGSGTAKFCGAFAKKPWSFGVVPGQSALVRVALSFSFDGNKVGAGSVKAAPSFENASLPVPPPGVQAVQSAADNILSALKAGGGKATPETVKLTVKCPVVNAGKPVAVVVPASGGL
jgi:hypothetical protein